MHCPSKFLASSRFPAPILLGPAQAVHSSVAVLFNMLRVVIPEDKEQVSLFAANVFTEHEPMTRATGASVSDIVQLFGPIIEACCSSGMSFMLEQQEPGSSNSTIMCLSLALPYSQYKAMQWPPVKSAQPASEIMKTLPQVPAEQQQAAVYMFLWWTHANHMGKGYIRTVVGESMRAARQAGFSSLVADVTNVVSQHVAMSHFGFQPMEPKARYHDHECFKAVQGTEFIIRAVKHIAAEPAGVQA